MESINVRQHGESEVYVRRMVRFPLQPDVESIKEHQNEHLKYTANSTGRLKLSKIGLKRNGNPLSILLGWYT